jgi:DNA-binding IclR family transcriptional regulator
VSLGPQQGHDGVASAGRNRSVTRALAILDLIAAADQPVTLSMISRRLDVPKSSALSFLKALVGAELAEVNEYGEYTLGVHSFELGAAYLRATTPLTAAERQLQALTDTLGVTSHFAILDGSDVVYLAKHDPPGLGFRLASALGARLPAHLTAVGKAQLAHIDANGRTRLDAQLEDELRQVREDGYAIDEGLTAVGIRCVASPVFDSAHCCGAIGVSYAMDNGGDWREVADEVTAAAERASRQLGRLPVGAHAGGQDGD